MTEFLEEFVGLGATSTEVDVTVEQAGSGHHDYRNAVISHREVDLPFNHCPVS